MTLIVDGEKIEDAEIQQEVQRLRPHFEQVFGDHDPEQREAQLLDWSRENVIERVLLNRHATEHGEQIPPAQVDRAFELMKKQYTDSDRLQREFETDNETEIKQRIELQMRVDRLLQDACKDLPEPSEQDIAEFYERNKEKYISAERIRVAHIVKHITGQTDETAAFAAIRKAQNELKSGTPFEMLVPTYSDCPENGGDLGYITRGQMVEEFEDVVFNLALGRVSNLFRTRFGYHIAKLYDRKPAVTPPLEQVKEQVVNDLKEQMRNDVVDRFLDELRSRAEIKEI
ncbi:MAG: peptidylprolyl isomerase [Planctomycetota bacterium]|jgi:parvulin-like peptidyl-prolyl isomerase